LIDDIGTLEEVIRGGWNLNWYDFGPRRPAGLLGVEAASDLVAQILERTLARADFSLR
jgi:hypothetical protein